MFLFGPYFSPKKIWIYSRISAILCKNFSSVSFHQYPKNWYNFILFLRTRTTNTNKTVLEYLTFKDCLYACLYDSILKDFTLYKQYTNQRFFLKENPRNSPLWTKAWKGCLHTVSAPLSATCGNCSKKSPSSFARRTASYYTPT